MKDLRGEQNLAEFTSVDLSIPKLIIVFKFTEGCSNLPRRSRGRFGQTEANLNKYHESEDILIDE